MKQKLITFALICSSALVVAEEPNSGSVSPDLDIIASDKTRIYTRLGNVVTEDVDQGFDLREISFAIEMFEQDNGQFGIIRADRTEAVKLYDELTVNGTEYMFSIGTGYDYGLTSMLSATAEISGGFGYYDAIWADSENASLGTAFILRADGRTGIRFDSGGM